MRRFLLIAALLTTACASTANFERRLQSWVGRDINEVMLAWGPPTQTFEMPNKQKQYLWALRGQTIARAVDLPYGQTIATANQLWCDTTLLADTSGTVLAWQWRGNSCKSPK